jgi:hypothetical protein
MVFFSHIEKIGDYLSPSREMLLALDDTITWMISENKEFLKNKSFPTIEKVLEKRKVITILISFLTSCRWAEPRNTYRNGRIGMSLSTLGNLPLM